MAGSIIVLGNSWSQPPYQAKDELYYDKFGLKITRIYRALYATWTRYAPGVGSSHPLYPYCLFTSGTARQIVPGFLCDVTLKYEQQQPNIEQPPPTAVSESGSVIEEDIRNHPDFKTTFKQYWDEDKLEFITSAPDYLRGVTKYIVGSSTVTVTKYTASEPSGVQDDLGTVQTPGYGYGRNGHYLVVSGSKNKQGIWWARTLVYQYSSLLVPTQIYHN